MKLFKTNTGFGQSSTPKWVLGTIQFIWVWGFPLHPSHKMIFSQKYFFRDQKLTPKRPRAKMSTWRSPNFRFFGTSPNGAKRYPQPLLAKSYAFPRPQSSKRSHEVKNIFFGKPKLFWCKPKLFRCKPKLFRCKPKLFLCKPKLFLCKPKLFRCKPKLFWSKV